MANHQDRVITYVPREESGDGKEMGSLRRGVSSVSYTHLTLPTKRIV